VGVVGRGWGSGVGVVGRGWGSGVGGGVGVGWGWGGYVEQGGAGIVQCKPVFKLT